MSHGNKSCGKPGNDYVLYAFIDEQAVPYYVGQSYNMKNRMNMHNKYIKDAVERYPQSKYPYYRKARKLLKDGCFKFIILESNLSKQEVDTLEEQYIVNNRTTLYNFLPGGRNNQRGKKVSDETKRKISDAKVGKKFTKEHKQSLSKAKIGIKLNLSLEQLEQRKTECINRFKGKPLSKEHIEKIRKDKTGKKYSEESNKKKGRTGILHNASKKYELISPSGFSICLFGLSSEFLKHYNLTQSGLWQAIEGNRKYKGWQIKLLTNI